MRAFGMAGQRFGRLVVVREGPGKPIKNKTYRRRTMICRCDCGSPDKEILLELLTAGGTKRGRGTRSCGCLRREVVSWQNSQIKKTHGMRKHELYATWTGERARCGTPTNPQYKGYGGRGITFYEPWQDFAVFVHDVEAEIGPRPEGRHPNGKPKYSLDRKNNDGNYEPGNIRWVTDHESMLNRRSVHVLTARIMELEEENRRLLAELGAMTAELDVERERYR